MQRARATAIVNSAGTIRVQMERTPLSAKLTAVSQFAAILRASKASRVPPALQTVALALIPAVTAFAVALNRATSAQ